MLCDSVTHRLKHVNNILMVLLLKEVNTAYLTALLFPVVPLTSLLVKSPNDDESWEIRDNSFYPVIATYCHSNCCSAKVTHCLKKLI